MYVVERLWSVVTSVISIVSLSPLQDGIDNQSPIPIPSQVVPQLQDIVDSQSRLPIPSQGTPQLIASKGPVFHPPGAPQTDTFQCNYSAMVGWELCSTEIDRSCWLRRTLDGKQYDINTNYEDDAPIGTTRQYSLELDGGSYDADGMMFDEAKLFNNMYPGPWIEACWGDTIEVNVTNKLQYNGTSVHWHGIRQNQTMHMDGVNGITQCPIAPQDYFVYKFNVTQYGSSWYHSHYSVQYADGAVGPMTLHGPSSLAYDEAISPPLILTDWGHNSAFVALTQGLENKDILLNGRGNVTNYSNGTPNTTTIKNPYHISFEGPQLGQRIKKYLLRVINTSFDTTFVFSIDNHRLHIVSTDFVPIQPYPNTSVLVGIGQRYNVIVEANPEVYNETDSLPDDGNYWIRTYISPCKGDNTECNGPEGASCGYERTGILRYNSSSTANPSSKPWQNVSLTCSDETYGDIHPIVPWIVDPPINGPVYGQHFGLGVGGDPKNPNFPLSSWTLSTEDEGFRSIRVNYSDPTFFHLDNTGPWDPAWRIESENYTSKDWVYLVIAANKVGGFGAHPIHLHGHDFALLEQAYDKEFNPANLSLTLVNPPRRDVVLMPRSGYVVIAFRADNPGAWLVHCHIAFHISEGLGMQIMERQGDANAIWPKGDSKALAEAGRVCQNWKTFYTNEAGWAPPGADCGQLDKDWCFQDDSGV